MTPTNPQTTPEPRSTAPHTVPHPPHRTTPAAFEFDLPARQSARQRPGYDAVLRRLTAAGGNPR